MKIIGMKFVFMLESLVNIQLEDSGDNHQIWRISMKMGAEFTHIIT
jgi:hypothetical protein